MKRILFCSPVERSKELGGSKVVVELAEEMQEIGWNCQIICPSDVAGPGDKDAVESFPENLRRYLKQHASEYDVVDYDHGYLPFGRSEFSSQTLLVARSVLLAHHLDTIQIPEPAGIKSAIGRIIKGESRQRQKREIVRCAHATVQQADVVNVSNDYDKAELIKQGIAEERIVVLPYGISRSRRPLFDGVRSEVPLSPAIAFVGTFDYRKGAREFSSIAQSVINAIPEAQFCLLGTSGMFKTADEVLAHFPKAVWKNLKVVPKYRPEELPALLAPCSIGVFPSYIEGMPFGVLEMLAASVPVIAYDAPGPSMMLPPEYLVPRGDVNAMSTKVLGLLNNKDELLRARIYAKKRSQQFSWEETAKITSDVYCKQLQLKQKT